MEYFFFVINTISEIQKIIYNVKDKDIYLYTYYILYLMCLFNWYTVLIINKQINFINHATENYAKHYINYDYSAFKQIHAMNCIKFT